MNFIYSKAFMIKSQSLEIAKLCPNEISCLKIEIENINLPSELRLEPNLGFQRRNRPDRNDRHDRHDRHDRTPVKWERCPLPKAKTVMNSLPPDIKRITAILNKISDENFDKMVEETKTFNYADPEVVTVIFRKILAEPFFSDVYAKFCDSLEDLHDIINERCIIEFNKTKHKNLGKFIGELYKLDLLDDLDSFIDALLDDIDEAKLETLCKIITTIGVKNELFVDIIADLNSNKSKFSSRHKFMIMDIVEGRPPKIP
jgi:hypothetical protein